MGFKIAWAGMCLSCCIERHENDWRWKSSPSKLATRPQCANTLGTEKESASKRERERERERERARERRRERDRECELRLQVLEECEDGSCRAILDTGTSLPRPKSKFQLLQESWIPESLDLEVGSPAAGLPKQVMMHNFRSEMFSFACQAVRAMHRMLARPVAEEHPVAERGQSLEVTKASSLELARVVVYKHSL